MFLENVFQVRQAKDFCLDKPNFENDISVAEFVYEKYKEYIAASPNEYNDNTIDEQELKKIIDAFFVWRFDLIS